MAHHLDTEPLGRNCWRGRLAAGLMALVAAACGGGAAPTEPPAAMQPTSLTGADGARMGYPPAEGLPAAAPSIARAEAGAPALPPGVEAAGTG